jgi:formylglycine-generating enzyme required for sulfatase activity
MLYIPKGTFQMGSNDGDPDEKPLRQVPVEAFCIDRTEVTVGAYAKCVETNKCIPAPKTVRWEGYTTQEVEFYSQFCNAGRIGRKEHPINCVDWNMSKAYCETLGKQLPTEEEWEYAARGTDGRDYPWGNDKPSKDVLNACGDECVTMLQTKGKTISSMYKGDDSFPDTAPVNSFPAGASPFNAVDMAGNVSEWTSSPDMRNYDRNQKSEINRVFRGGSWNLASASHGRAS